MKLRVQPTPPAPSAAPEEEVEEIAEADNSSLGNVPMQRIALSNLKVADYNPRFITSKAKKGLSASLDKFGLVQPIIVNTRTMNIVGGHQRFEYLKSKGVTETDVVTVDLPLNKEKQLNITLNNPKIQGDFNSSLAQLIDDLDISMPERDELNIDDLIAAVGITESAATNATTSPSEDEPTERKKKDKDKKKEGKNDNPFDASSNFSVPLSLDQHSYVFDTIRKVKSDMGKQTTAEALIALCDRYNGEVA